MSTGHRRPWLALGALVVSLGLVSLACGSGEDASSSSVSSSGATSPTDGGSGSGDAATPAPEAVQHLDIEAAAVPPADQHPLRAVVNQLVAGPARWQGGLELG